ncbi:unnamed protein product [Caretta caretta]
MQTDECLTSLSGQRAQSCVVEHAQPCVMEDVRKVQTASALSGRPRCSGTCGIFLLGFLILWNLGDSAAF